MKHKKSVIARFWSKVDRGMACWLWTAGVTEDGYGRMRLSGHNSGPRIRAHRLSWELHFGAIPVGLVVCHHCDNPRCVNPAHLFLGTVATNNRDMADKDRVSHGARHPLAILDDSKVRDIRSRYETGQSIRSISEAYGVSKTCVEAVIQRRTWTRVA